jgi:hypothetical protein
VTIRDPELAAYFAELRADLDASLARELRQAEQLDEIFAAFLDPPRSVEEIRMRLAVWQFPDARSRLRDSSRGDLIGSDSCKDDPS